MPTFYFYIPSFFGGWRGMGGHVSTEKEELTDFCQSTVIEQELRKNYYVKSQSQCVFICLLWQKLVSDLDPAALAGLSTCNHTFHAPPKMLNIHKQFHDK